MQDCVLDPQYKVPHNTKHKLREQGKTNKKNTRVYRVTLLNPHRVNACFAHLGSALDDGALFGEPSIPLDVKLRIIMGTSNRTVVFRTTRPQTRKKGVRKQKGELRLLKSLIQTLISTFVGPRRFRA